MWDRYKRQYFILLYFLKDNWKLRAKTITRYSVLWYKQRLSAAKAQKFAFPVLMPSFLGLFIWSLGQRSSPGVFAETCLLGRRRREIMKTLFCTLAQYPVFSTPSPSSKPPLPKSIRLPDSRVPGFVQALSTVRKSHISAEPQDPPPARSSMGEMEHREAEPFSLFPPPSPSQ